MGKTHPKCLIAIEFELTHKVEQLSAFHQTVLLRLS